MASCTTLLIVFITVQTICQGASPNDQNSYPRISEHPQNGYLAKDNPATLNCQADGNPPPTITWYHNGEKVATIDEDPYSQKMLIEGGKLFFLRVIHQKDKSDAGVYYCNATNRLGSAISRNATLKIAVLRDDFLQSPSNKSVSIGDKAIFSCRPPRGEPEPKVLWMKGRKFLTDSNRIKILENGDLIISQVTLNDADNYKCIATNTAGEKESAPARLTVLEKPSFRKAPVDQITMEGKAVHFPCEVVGDQPISVEWRKENGALKFGRVRVLNDNTLRIEKAEAEDAGLYVCMASNSVGTAEAVARLTVQYMPSFDVRPHDQVVGVRRTVTMHCSVTGIPQPTIIWSKTSNKPSGEKTLLFQNTASGRFSVASDGTLRIERVQLGDTGQYECEAINGLGSAKASARLEVKESDPLLFSVNDTRPPPIIRIGPQSQNLPTGEVGFLHCEAYGDPKPKIWWLKDGRPITANSRIISLSSGTLQISDLQESDSGNYTCKASSETGETSQSATLLVKKSNKNVTFHRTQDVKTFPGPPSKPTVVEVLTNSIKLSWQPNNNHGDSPVYAYIVEYFSHETSEGWVVASDSVPPTTTSVQPTTYTVTNLKPDTTYVFLVRARNSHGVGVPSELSDPISTRTVTDNSRNTQLTRKQIQNRLQGIVVELTAVEPLPAAVEVRWKVHKMMAIIDKFVIEYREIRDLKTGKMGRMNSVTVSRTSLSYTIQNLQSHQWYSICIKAYSQDIATQCSQPMKVQPTEPRRGIKFPPQHITAPSHVVIHKTTDTSISLQWLPPNDVTHSNIKSYEISCLSKENKHNCSRSIPANHTSYVLENLKADQTYTVKIAARTISGVGSWSKEYVIGPEKESLMKQPWFIGLLISIIGVTLWFALCIFVVWLCRKRKAMKKQKMQEMYSVPNYAKSDDSNRNSFNYYAKYGYSQKDAQNRAGGMTQMAPEFAQLLEQKDMEMQQGQGPSVYNVPQMKTFYQKKDPVAPYATTTLINAGNAVGGHSMQDHMFRPITQHSQQSGSGDSGCCKHECSGDSNTSHSNTGVPVDHADAMQSPTSDSGSHTTDENGFLLKKGKKPLKQITQPKQAMVNWAEFLPPPPEHPPPPSEMNMSQHSSGNSSTSQQYAEINCLNREMGARSPMSPMSKISSCSCPVPHNGTPVSGWNMPPYSDTGCVRCCSPKYFENVHYPPNQYNMVQRTQSPRGQEWNNCPRGHDTWGQRTIACMNASRGTPTDFKCRTCHSDQEQGGPMPQLQNYKIVPHCENDYQFLHESEQGPSSSYNMPPSYTGLYNVHGDGGQCVEHPCQSNMAEPCSPVYHNNKMDGHHMNIGVDGYHRNADSPVSDNGPDYAGESTELETEDENSPRKEGENEGQDEGGNMSGIETWPSYTDQCNTEDSSDHSSCHSDSDEAFLNEADFASTLAKAAEMSGLTVVGSTVSDPNADKQVVKKQRRHYRPRPTSPYSTDSNFSEVVRKPYPKSQRKKQLMDQGKWPNKRDSPSGSTASQSQSKYSQHDGNIPSYNKPNFPNAVPQKACRPKFQPQLSINKSEDSKDEGQDSGINVEPTSKEGLRTLKV
ncbi:roundabout homolog 1-like isoform X2 [Saccostrea echinata]|uniref:roundabout homolog 1-like isoform X2 n=1 Tax=Saccostrea echinata TaxID=191078 RepID=UPI002A81EA82|nr:roundabout homolog 1-like isoform X2 [Saccostrea echinata]